MTKRKPKNELQKAGRSTLYRYQYCTQLINHMKNGYSFESFCANVNVGSYSTLYKWLEKYPEFAEAKVKGEALGLLFWEQVGRKLAMTGRGNASAWIFMMKNRYGWRDKRELEVSKDGEKTVTITIEEMSREDRLKRLAELEDGKTIDAEVVTDND